MSLKLTLCQSCGAVVGSERVSSWRAVDGGRELFFECGVCGADGRIVLSSMVLKALMSRGQPVGGVDEFLMDLWRFDLEGIDDVGDMLLLWGYQEATAPATVPKERV